MWDKLPELYMVVFGGTALAGVIFGVVCKEWFLAIFCLVGLFIIGFWYYKMKT